MTLRLLVVALLSTLIGGCTLGRIHATNGADVALTRIVRGPSRPFVVTKRYVFDYTMAMDVQELVREALAQEGVGADVLAQNVSVKVQLDALDLLINALTLGLAMSRTFEASGDIVDARDALR